MELIRKYKQGKLTMRDIRKLNYCVIFLMVLVAIFSIIWSVTLHLLSGDINNQIISAKVVFKGRDFTQMDNRSQEIFQQDLNKLGHLTYKPKQETSQALRTESPTKKPEPKIKHVYESRENAVYLARVMSQEEEQERSTTTTTMAPEVVLNAEADHNFLATQCIDAVGTLWSRGIGARFVYDFPVISEIVAIVWTSMCLIFQTGNKKTSILPKPWRIVVPSIVIFSLMSLGSVAYSILTNGYLKRLCSNLRQGLTNPQGVSCGTAITLLRPQIHEHSVSYDVYLDVFRSSYIISTILWILALLVVVLRYSFAIDFRLVDIDDYFHHHSSPAVQAVYTEVSQVEQPPRPKSEDDYQSAKSRLSELAVPLLEVKAGVPERQSVATVS